MSYRLTAFGAQVLGAGPHAHQRFTAIGAQVIGKHLHNQFRVTQLTAQLLCHSLIPQKPPRWDHIAVQVLATRTPDFTWIDTMFVNEVFPFDISYNSVAATKFATDVIIVDSGSDQRVSRWDQPLMEYNIAYGVRTMEQLHALIAFFRMARGRKFGFLYNDYVDNSSKQATRYESRTIPPPDFADQEIGIGDEVAFTFQLTKLYPAPAGSSQTRIIQKPQPGSVTVGINGIQSSSWSCDFDQGKITFSSDFTLTAQQLGTLDLVKNPDGTVTITAESGAPFPPSILNRRIVTDGWINPENNISVSTRLQVTQRSNDGKSITLTSTNPKYGSTEPGNQTARILAHPAPDAGAVVTAGFKFYVPVRFDTDRLPTSLTDYGVGDVTDVKLVELRPSENTGGVVA